MDTIATEPIEEQVAESARKRNGLGAFLVVVMVVAITASGEYARHGFWTSIWVDDTWSSIWEAFWTPAFDVQELGPKNVFYILRFITPTACLIGLYVLFPPWLRSLQVFLFCSSDLRAQRLKRTFFLLGIISLFTALALSGRYLHRVHSDLKASQYGLSETERELQELKGEIDGVSHEKSGLTQNLVDVKQELEATKNKLVYAEGLLAQVDQSAVEKLKSEKTRYENANRELQQEVTRLSDLLAVHYKPEDKLTRAERWDQIRLGLTDDQVETILGAPQSVMVSNWSYPDGSVSFNYHNRVDGFSKP